MRMSVIHLVGVVVMLGTSAGTEPMMSKSAQAMYAIASDAGLSAEQKIQRLRAYFPQEKDWRPVLYWIEQVDRNAVPGIAQELFRDPATSRTHKLQLGRCLLTCRAGAPPHAPGFAATFAPFLVGAILEDKGDEYMRAREEDTLTAVGEYAFLAGGFNGYPRELFEPFKDPRVIPVLIRCLGAPDEVWPLEPIHCMSGKPGEPTGRDISRQNIPLALARLGSVEATSDLRKTLLTHHDYWLRYNSAYALAFLLDRRISREIETAILALKDKESPLLLFPFGSGLIARNNADGISYLSFRYSTYSNRSGIPSVIYMLRERLEAIRGFKHRRAEEFFREALDYGPMQPILLFDQDRLDQVERPPRDDAVKMEMWRLSWDLTRASERIVETYKALLAAMNQSQCDLSSLAPRVAGIADKSKSGEIRKASREWLDGLQGGGQAR